MVTMENFKMNEYTWKPIESDGYWNSYSRRWDINYSAILSNLIIEAGKFCECFASDLFIDWRVIETELENIDYRGGSYLFGFRQNGVDHNNFVFNRYKNDGKNCRTWAQFSDKVLEYRAIFTNERLYLQ